MTTYTRPGVIVNQSLTPLTASSSGAVGGAVACFAGAYNIGPTVPTFITSWQNFTQLYGNWNVANASPLAYAVYQYFTNGGSGCYVYRVPNTDATVASLGILDVTVTSPTDTLTLTALHPGIWGNSIYVEIIATGTGAGNTANFTLNIYQGGTTSTNLVESWPAVSLNPASPRNLVTLINGTAGGSLYVSAATNFGAGGYVQGTSDPVAIPPTALGTTGASTTGVTGSDGTTAPALDTAITAGISGTGWSCPGLANLPNQVLNLNLPAGPSAPITQTILNNVISWAVTQGNVFVVIDAPFGGLPLVSSSTLVTNYATYVSTGGTAISPQPNVAVYGPWLSIPDPASSSTTATRWVAPGGAMLGIWSRTDAQSSVAQTPAGTAATVNAVALEAYFTTADLNTLETAQINPVKNVPGVGFCVFGGRTLGTGYPNRYINVSRTLMQFAVDFVNATQFAIFQNNDASLWQSITSVLTSYLTTAMQNNMLAGTSPETAFQVTCDSTTTSAAQAQAGIVNATVAVALVSPAEFIIINLSQMQSGGTATVSS